MKVPKQSDLNASTCTERSMNIHYPEFAEYLRNTYKQEGLKWTERLYLYYNHLTERPVCVVCGKPVKFYNMNLGYARTCSRKCNGIDPLTREKVRQTSLERFGVENAAQSKMAREKTIKTCMERYGLTNGGWSKQAQEKIRATNQKHKSKPHSVQFPDLNYENDITYTAQIESVKNKVISRVRQSTPITHEDIIGFTPSGDWICKCPHPDCTKCEEKKYTIPSGIYRARLSLGAELCTNLLPVQSLSSNMELIVRGWLDEVGIEYITNDRSVLPSGFEIDIYIPTLKIGIECNGVFWHSSKFKSNAYHINKTKEAASVGVRLYHIWEDWVINTPDVIKSMVLNWVGKSPDRIYARKCELRPVDSLEGLNFLEHNHIQGRSSYSVGFGLYYEGKLVSLMTFGKKRGCVGNSKNKEMDGEWELIRFCSALNTSVVGAAGKLLKHFIQRYHPDTIYSYASQDISIGGVYKTLGFISDGKVTQSYWYVDPVSFKRYHRTSFTKSSIVRKGWRDQIDSSWTEKEVMDEQGYFRIHDAGQTKWILKL